MSMQKEWALFPEGGHKFGEVMLFKYGFIQGKMALP
jgi:hypothetical protein